MIVMPTKTATQEWIELSSGLSVAAKRMPNSPFYEATTMNVYEFNKKANKYDVNISHKDSSIVKTVKFLTFLKRNGTEDKDSFIPTTSQYVEMGIDAATAEEGLLASFYRDTLCPVERPKSRSDLTRDVLEFQGEGKDGYIFTLFELNENGILEPIENITVANHDGHIWKLGNHRYPVEASEGSGYWGIRAIQIPDRDDVNIRGYFFVGEKMLKTGDKRLVMHFPNKESPVNIDISKNWLYHDMKNYVDVLLMRNPISKD